MKTIDTESIVEALNCLHRINNTVNEFAHIKQLFSSGLLTELEQEIERFTEEENKRYNSVGL